jgi:hypothetical protein
MQTKPGDRNDGSDEDIEDQQYSDQDDADNLPQANEDGSSSGGGSFENVGQGSGERVEEADRGVESQRNEARLQGSSNDGQRPKLHAQSRLSQLQNGSNIKKKSNRDNMSRQESNNGGSNKYDLDLNADAEIEDSQHEKPMSFNSQKGLGQNSNR